jgi:hypothetical protein
MRRKTASCATPESSTKGGSFISRAIHRFIFHRIDKQAYWNKFIDFRNESSARPAACWQRAAHRGANPHRQRAGPQRNG